MLRSILQEERDKIAEDTKRNQQIHTQYREEARKELYEKRKTSGRFPHKFNQGYSYKAK